MLILEAASLLALLVALPPVAAAADLVWVGNDAFNSSNFSNSGNWQSNTLPSWGYANSLKFNQNLNSNVTGLNYNWGDWRQVNDIFWDSTFTVSRTLSASNGGGIGFKTRIENQSSSTQTVAMELSGGSDGASDIQLNPVKGSLIFSGTLWNDNSKDYVVYGSDTATVTNLTLNTALGPNAPTQANVDFTVAGGRNSAVQVNASQVWAGTTTVNSGSFTTANGVTLASSAIVVGGGTVATTSANTLADSASLTVNSGRLSIGGSDTVASLAGSGGTVDLAAGATLTFGNASSTSYAGSITGSGGFTKIGAGVVTLTGNNSTSGGTVVSQGALAGGASSSFGSGSIVLGDGNTGTSSVVLVANSSGNTTIANAITVANLGTGLVSIGGTNTGSGSYNAWTGTLTLNRNVQLFGDTTPGSSGRTSFLGQITGSGGITVTQGRVTLQSTTNNFTGPVVVNSGATLQLDVANGINEVIPNSSAVTVNGALNFASGGGTETIGSLAGSGTVSSVVSGTYSLIIGGSNSTTFSGAINNGTGTIGLTQSGSGTLTLTGNNTYTGNTTITNGGTQVLNFASFGSGARNYVISSNSVVVLNATSTITAASGSSAIAGSGTLLVTNGLLCTTNDSILTIAMGSGGLINVAAGATVRNGGWKNINWTNNQASMMLDGAVDIWDGQDIFIDALNGSGAVTNSDQYRGNINFTLGAANGSGTFTGQLTAPNLSVIKSGTGTQILAGTNTYTNSTTISGGTLVISGLLGNGSYAASITNNASLAFSNSASQTLSGVISGSGTLTKAGLGTLTLSQANSYSGGTTITGGTVQISAGGSAGGSTAGLGTGTVSIASGAQLTYYLSTTGSHTITNAFALSGGTLYSEDGNNTFSGRVTLASGASTISSRYQDTITLSGGLAGSGNVLFTQAGGLGDGPTYVLSGTGANTGTVRVSGSSNGRITKLQVANVNALQSATLDLATGDVGTVEFSVPGTNTYALGGLQGARNLAFGGNSLSVGGNGQSTTYSGVLTGSGSLTKVGGGRLALAGANTFSGVTNVNAGELALNGSIAGGLNVASIASLSGTGTVGGNATIIGTHSPGNSPGAQTFNANLTYQAGAVVNWELIANNTGAPGTNYDQIIMPTGNLAFSGSTTLALSFNSAGSVVDWTNAFWNVNRSWTVYDLSGGSTTGLGNLVLGGSLLDSLGNSLSPTARGYFTTSLSGQDVILNFVAVPEPSTVGLALAGLACGGWMARRRRCSS
ncbi:MAG: PEP-CTERM sorting domain-containing protein [Planctomycetia bacterium]|nr:PEP-CTERM sorting domain-containing protein [Planctomycetia bacterium]